MDRSQGGSGRISDLCDGCDSTLAPIFWLMAWTVLRRSRDDYHQRELCDRQERAG
jgi:hypothetical protein